jgi:uncharacterized RDD family membrane protein YckC
MTEAAVTLESVARHERATVFLEGRARPRRRLAVNTPEGVMLFFGLADAGERVTAFALDMVFWILATAAIYLGLGFILFGTSALGGEVGATIALSMLLFMGFVVRNLYFIYFELAWQGSTPGKRIVGIKVIDRKGGPLQPMAIVARNLTREVEAFIPLGLLLSPGTGAGIWERLALLAWLLLLTALPLFNRDRLRGGDLIAGTAVVALPRRLLLADLVDAGARLGFSERHLGVYGAFELHVLEDILRRPDAPDAAQLRREVCDKICRKIGWTVKVADADIERFLKDFYVAQRAHLEREQLYGKFRADKTAAKSTPARV